MEGHVDGKVTENFSKNPGDNQVPIYRQRPPRPMTNLGFRIYEDQKTKLANEYVGKSSELVRILLDKFFRGELPDVKEQLS